MRWCLQTPTPLSQPAQPMGTWDLHPWQVAVLAGFTAMGLGTVVGQDSRNSGVCLPWKCAWPSEVPFSTFHTLLLLQTEQKCSWGYRKRRTKWSRKPGRCLTAR